MTPYLSVVKLSLVFLSLLTATLFVFIVIRRAFVDLQSRYFKNICAQIEKELLAGLASGDTSQAIAIAQKFASKPKALAHVLISYAQRLKGPSLAHLKLIFDESLKSRVYRDLNSFFLDRKVRAIRLLTYLGDPSDLPLLFPMLQKKPIIRLTTIQALAQTKKPEALEAIFSAWEKEPPSYASIYANLFYSLGVTIEPWVKKYLKLPLPKEKLSSLIEVTGLIPLRALSPDLLPFVSHPEKEVRIKVARALGRLLIPETFEALISLLEDEAWEVQAQAARALGRLKNPMSISHLIQGLTSPFFYVRRNAAYALAEIGTEGRAALREVIRQNKDRFAKETAAMVLEEIAEI